MKSPFDPAMIIRSPIDGNLEATCDDVHEYGRRCEAIS